MQDQIVILCADAPFARMLELEFRFLQKRVRCAASMDADDRADVVILDLDSALPPPDSPFGTLIGFTREPAPYEEAARRRCSLVLHRPFEMRRLREEVESLFPDGGAVSHRENDPPALRLSEKGGFLFCKNEKIPLSPTEYQIVKVLLSRRGNPVPREELTALIGGSAANKTDVYICYLRKKLAPFGADRLIETVRGQGYRIH